MIEELAKIICFNIDTLSSCDEPCITCTRQAEAVVEFVKNWKPVEGESDGIECT